MLRRSLGRFRTRTGAGADCARCTWADEAGSTIRVEDLLGPFRASSRTPIVVLAPLQSISRMLLRKGYSRRHEFAASSRDTHAVRRGGTSQRRGC